MVEVLLDDGQRVFALNGVFLGHASHQSARYLLRSPGGAERQGSSGIVVTTGGATGWGRSVGLQRHTAMRIPAPDEPAQASSTSKDRRSRIIVDCAGRLRQSG